MSCSDQTFGVIMKKPYTGTSAVKDPSEIRDNEFCEFILPYKTYYIIQDKNTFD